MTPVDLFRIASVPAWGFVLCACLWAMRGVTRLRTCPLDGLWIVISLLALNRLSFVLRVSPLLSHASAFFLALVLAGLILWCDRQQDA